MIEPSRYIQYIRELQKYPTFRPPRGVILSYQKKLIEFVRNNHETQPCDGFLPNLLFLKETGNQIAIMGGFGIGSPTAGIVLEELIAFGVSEFISIGTAGTLQPHVQIGDIVVCDRAIRDEGTSHHYAAVEKYAHPNKAMTDRFANALNKSGQKYHVGTTWTIDAPYRETLSEARHYQSEGVLTVEMEASALFAVSKFRNVPMAAAFTISDSLAELKWRPEFHNSKTKEGLENLYQAALATF